MDLFACRRGMVSVMEGCQGVPGKLQLEGFEPLAAIIEAPGMKQNVNAQFMSSLADAVYVYVFGDKMGSVTLSGLAFAGKCGDSSASGLKDLNDYYKNFRASQRREAVIVTIGPISFSGFLTDLEITTRSVSDMVMSFTLFIRTLPKKGA